MLEGCGRSDLTGHRPNIRKAPLGPGRARLYRGPNSLVLELVPEHFGDGGLTCEKARSISWNLGVQHWSVSRPKSEGGGPVDLSFWLLYQARCWLVFDVACGSQSLGQCWRMAQFVSHFEFVRG